MVGHNVELPQVSMLIRVREVSGYQPSINWSTVKANGVQFAYIKATEGTSECMIVCVRIRDLSVGAAYTNPSFSSVSGAC